MDINQWMTVAFGVVTVGLLLYVVVRKPPASIGEAQAQLSEAVEAARAYVMAAEQLWRTGKLPKEQRFEYAARQLIAQGNLDVEQVTALVESAVYWLKLAVAQQTGKPAKTPIFTGTPSSPPAQPEGAQGLPVREA
jgi:hypothetical protein